MRVHALQVSGFRNLEPAVFEPGGAVNVLYGNNGQGKTNLIEALWLCTGEKSFRGSGSRELIRLGAREAMLRLRFSARDTEQDIRLGFGPQRTVKLNGVEEESPGKLVGSFCAVIFSPDHLGLIKAGPRIRRQFLDAAISQIWPRHAATLNDYEKTLFQRNALLKDIPAHAELLDTLEVWDEKLAALGARLQFARLRYLLRLEPAARACYDGLSDGREPFRLSYLAADGRTMSLLPGESPESCRRRLETALQQAQKDSLRQDLERGFSSAGPHRDELLLCISGMPARLYASQGQQRSAVLALKLAEAGVLRDTLREPPVLLLDDVMSELDSARRDYLLNHLGGYQIFITCCDPSGFASLKQGEAFRVRAGRIFPENGKTADAAAAGPVPNPLPAGNISPENARPSDPDPADADMTQEAPPASAAERDIPAEKRTLER